MKRLVATVSTAALGVGVGVVMPSPASAEEYDVTEVSFGPPTITFTKTNPQYVNPRVGDTLTFTYPLPDPPAGSVMGGTEVRTWYGIATSEESCREHIGGLNDGLPRMLEEDAQYKLLGNRGLTPASDVDSLSVTLPIEQSWVGGFPCAITQINWQSGRRGSIVFHEQYSAPSVGRRIQPLVEAIPVEPRQPYLLDPEKAVAGGGVTAVGLLFGDLINSPQISQRRLGFSLMSVARDRCDTTRAIYQPGEGVGSIYGSFAIPSDAASKYLCIFQEATVGGERMTSLPRYYQIARGQVTLPSAPAISLSTALGRLQQAAANLQQAQSQPNVDQAALAQAVAEAEAARREVEAAAVRAQQANNGAQNQAAGQNNAAATPAQIAAAQAEVDAVAAQVTTALGATAVGTGTASRSMAGLVRATGFDPLATPILAANAKNASGVSINVDAPAQAKQRTRIFTKLRVNEPVTRGGMRQYFLSLDGGEPRLLLQRTGFVPKGEKTKRFWMSRNFPAGTYGLLTTFQPSTPGMEGVATYQTIEIVDNPKKKKKKNRR